MRCTRLLAGTAAAAALGSSLALLGAGTADAMPNCDGPTPPPICEPHPPTPRPAIPDLSVSLAAASSVGAGQPLTYTATISNSVGTYAAPGAPVSGLAVRVQLPAGTSAISTSATNGLTCTVSGTTVSCGNGSLAKGASATITVATHAPTTAGTATASAVVDPANVIAERNESNNSATVSTTVTALPDLTVSMNGPATIEGLAQVGAWTITVRNAGAASATGIDVRWLTNWGGDVNANYTQSGGFTCTISPEDLQQVVYCHAPGLTLAPGQTATITINAVPPAPNNLYGTVGAGTETATVDYGQVVTESDETNNSAAVQTTITW